MAVRILDCTLRDGGYYTQWDFNWDFVSTYLESIENTPIEYLEIGYRSKKQEMYMGEYYYLPESTIKNIKQISSKKLAIMLDIKNLDLRDLNDLILPIRESISMVRLASNPYKLDDALTFSKEIKQKFGLEVALNLMYFGNWVEDYMFLEQLNNIDVEFIDFIYFVDSFGSILPSQLVGLEQRLEKLFKSVKIGFHGHNNQEMALANSIEMMKIGVSIIDGTILGMGRGAGNLKTELLCLILKKNYDVNFELSSLNEVLEKIRIFKNIYKWGGEYAYSISGAYSIEQALVMEWLSDKFYSTSNIISALENKISSNTINTASFKTISSKIKMNKAVIIGGGESILVNSRLIKEFLLKFPEFGLIFTSTKYYSVFNDLKNLKFVCLVGDESKRFLGYYNGEGVICIVLNSKDNLTSVPQTLLSKTYHLEAISFSKLYKNAHTSLGIQVAIDLNLEEVGILGYDGYTSNISEKQHKLSLENQYLFAKATSFVNLKSLLPTSYNLKIESLFSYLL